MRRVSNLDFRKTEFGPVIFVCKFWGTFTLGEEIISLSEFVSLVSVSSHVKIFELEKSKPTGHNYVT